jgi:diaminopimelate decarboxylase
VLRFSALVRSLNLSVASLARASKGVVKRGLRAAVQAAASGSTALGPEYWGLERNAQAELSLDGQSLPALAAEFGSPLHVVNFGRLRQNARRFLDSAAQARLRCDVFYSFKTNPVPGVISELGAAGMGAEVISEYELWLARRLGFSPDRIVYNGPVKSEASLREAISSRILLLNVNHREELSLVSRVARELGQRARIGVRITVGAGWSGQFGTPVAGGLALRVFEEAVGNDALEVVGLHAHRGGMLRTEADALGFVDETLSFTDELRQRLGLELELLNLGGSLASPSVRGLSERELRNNRSFSSHIASPVPSESLPIERYVAAITERVATHYERLGRSAPRILLEPGRSVTSDAQMLLTRVHSLKLDAERAYAILDAGINLAESCRSEYHQLLSANHAGAPLSHVYAVAGPICTPGDTLYWSARLPELKPGDSLLIMDAGAYFVAFSTSFSFPRPAIVAVDAGTVKLLRRAETFDDLLALDQGQS